MKLRFTLISMLLCMVLGIAAEPIDKAEARRVAQELVSIDDNSSDEVAWAPYYVFSRGLHKGFVIVSGDDQTAPIIGYTDEGDFIEEELPAPLKDMLEVWAEKIIKLQTIDRPKTVHRSAKARVAEARRGVEAFKSKWEDIPEMIETRWHQTSPYNDLCPVKDGNRAVTGCVATAAAQIVYYFRRDNPDTLVYSTPTYTSDWGDSYGNYPVTESLPAGTKVEYNLMKTSGHGTQEQDHAVAVLMYAVGTSSYLNYGPSTGGQPNEAGNALANQFRLLSDYDGKWNYSQQGWEEKIYNSLKKGSPMLYGGTHPTSGGHAVVLDGYQASTGLYHFNFGWGGGGTSNGSGWYTVDDETGMNGFKSDQRGCLNFHPLKQNVTASIDRSILYNKVNCTLSFRLKNNGTLRYTGMKVYVGTTKTKPTTVTYQATDYVARGEEKVFSFDYKPTSTRLTYIYLCDANDNLLDTIAVPVKQTEADFRLNSMSVDGNGEKRTYDGHDYEVVTNLTAYVAANLTNGENGTVCQPSVTCKIERFDTEASEWKGVKTVTHGDTLFQVNDTKNMVFTVPNLQQGTYYRATILATAKAGRNSTIAMSGTDEDYVYFIVKEANMAFVEEERHVKITGNWNQALFDEKNYGADICSIDLTEAEDVMVLPTLPNKNALYYLREKVEGMPNVIVNDVCDSLVINPDYEFKANKPFTAAKATLLLGDILPGEWKTILVPFAATMPKGLLVSKLKRVTNTQALMEHAPEVEAMTPVMLMTDCKSHNAITAENVTIGTEVSMADEELKLASSTLYTEVPETFKVLKVNSNLPYFVTPSLTYIDRIDPFTVLLMSDSSNDLKAFSTSEQASLARMPELAETIDHAFDVLEENRDGASATALETFLQAIDTAETFFSSRDLNLSRINQQKTALEKAIEEFLTPSGIQILNINSESDSCNGQNEYYSLDGVRLAAPVKGVVIVKNGNNVRKMVIR